jgi:hypothetical protein
MNILVCAKNVAILDDEIVFTDDHLDADYLDGGLNA